MQIQRFLQGICRTALGLFFVLLLAAEGTSAGDAPRVQPVERLVVRYHAGAFELVGRATIQKVLPPSFALADSSGRVSGTWFELQTSAGGVLYRRPLPRPQIAYVEVLKDSTTGEIERREVTISERTFLVTVPQRDDAAQVAFYGPQAGSAGKSLASQVMGLIQLR